MSFDINNKSDTVVITGSNNDNTTNIVRIYKNINDSWTKLGLDLLSNGNDVSVSDNGKIIAITGVNDYARIYEFVENNNNTSEWIQLGSNIPTTGNIYQYTKCCLNSDGTIVTLLEVNGLDNENELGNIKTFQYRFGIWFQVGSTLEKNIAKKKTNIVCSSDGLTIAIGKPYKNNNTGEVIIYKLINDTWFKQGESITGSSQNDQLGLKIAINSAGNKLAISAYNNGKGMIKVFRFNIGMWTQLGSSIIGNENEELGYDLNINAEGNVITALTNTTFDKIYSYIIEQDWILVGTEPILIDSTNSHTEASIKTNEIGNIICYFYKESDSYKFSIHTWPTTEKIISSSNQSNLTNKLYTNSKVGINVTNPTEALDINGTVKATTFIGDGSQLTGLPEPDLTPYAPLENPSFTGDLTITGVAPVYTPLDVAVQLGQDIDGEADEDQISSCSLSSDGTIVAIGAWENDGNGSNSGHVRVYQYANNTWTQIGQDIDGEASGDRSGGTVSLSSDGTVVAIGAHRNDGNGEDSGHVRVYQYNGTDTWTQLGQDIDGEAAGDESSLWSLSLSSDGTIVAIGSISNDGTTGNRYDNRGHVRVYQYSSGSWTQLGQDFDGEAAGYRSGRSVSLSQDGTILAIGADRNAGNGDSSGHVKVFQWNETSWTQLGQNITGESIGDYSGFSVSLSSDGTILAIGAAWNDGNGVDSGHVRVYQYTNDTWTQLGQDIDGEAAGDRSGEAISLSSDGTILAIGAIGNDENGTYSGHVRVFQWNGTAWTQLGQDIDGEAAEDYSGYFNSVSLSGNGTTVAIGAPYNYGINGEESGHVRVYKIADLVNKGEGRITAKTFIGDGSQLTGLPDPDLSLYAPLENPSFTGDLTITGGGVVYTPLDVAVRLGQDIDGEAAEDESGYSISLSSDGTIVAIGATNNDGNGDSSGHVRVYQYANDTWTQIGQDIDGEAAGDRSGWSVSLSSDGTILAIGAYHNDGNGGASGHVRVYQWNGTDTWTQLGQDIGGEAASDYSGWSVSLSSDGTILAIGAVGNDGNGTDSGHVRVFQWNGTAWTQLGQDINGEAAYDGSGRSVSLSSDGTILAIGASDNDGNGDRSGHVRVYQWNGTAWIQLGQDIDGEAASNWSGYSVSLSSDGTIVAIGAAWNDGANGQDSGHVRVYQWNGTAWIQLGQDIDGEAAGDRSGEAISLSSDGTILAIGAPGHNAYKGNVRVYQWNGTAWIQLGQDIDGEAAGDYSGYENSVSLSGNGTTVAIGAYRNDGVNGSNSGHVRVYKIADLVTGGTITATSFIGDGSQLTGLPDPDLSLYAPLENPSFTGDLTITGVAPVYTPLDVAVQLGQDIDGEAAEDRSGWSVSLSSDGTIVAIGAIENDGNGIDSGHVRVYQWNGTTWTQLGQDIDGEATYDYSGHSVSLSSDGTILAIGATNNDGNGSSSGHVRVYQYANNTWTQLGSDIDGEAADDRSGYSVSLSSDGTIVACGAVYASVSTNETGHVRVYKYANNAWTQLGSDIDGAAHEDEFGYSVSLSSDGTIVAISAIYADGVDSGYVRVFQYSNNAWVQLGSDINGVVGDHSGWSVSLSSDGTIVAIGANGNSNSTGCVRVYQYSSGSWTQLGSNINGEAAIDGLGNSVSLSSDGTILAIGAPYNDGNGTNSGHVRLYQWNGTDTWTQIRQDIDGEAAGDQSGRSVSLSSDGTILAIGAGGNDGNGSYSGHVRVYKIADLVTGGTITAKTFIGDGSQLTGLPDPDLSLYAPLENPSFTGDLTITGGGGGVVYTPLDVAVQLGQDIDAEAAGDESGTSISLSSDGTILAIGAPYNDGVNGTDSGHVRVYQWNGTTWTQLGQDIDGEATYDESGSSVSLSSDGTILAIGATNNDGNGIDSGHVRVYQYNGTTWTQLGQDIDGEAAEDRSGSSVSLSSDGTIVAIGASYNNNGENLSNSGHVRVYQYNGTTWTQLGQDIDGEAVVDRSGEAINLSSDGTILAIGARNNDGNGSDSGHVRVYQYNGTDTWTQLGQDIDGEAAYDYSGQSISLSSDGTILAIGAPYNDGINGPYSGHVRVYQWDGTTWTQFGQDIDAEAAYDHSGVSVSLSSDGTILAIGAEYNDGNGEDSGHVRVYQWDGTTWTQLGQDIDGEAADDYSGYSVSLSSDGSIVAIGAYVNDGNGEDSGHVRVYKIANLVNQGGTITATSFIGDGSQLTGLPDPDLTPYAPLENPNFTGDLTITGSSETVYTPLDVAVQLGQDINGEAAGDESGYSVSLSSDGTIVAIGANQNYGNGGNSGHVRVYQYANDTWTQLGQDINGEAAGDESGYSVSLSSDGTIVAIGAPYNDGVNGTDSGHVRVYQWNGTAWTQLGQDIDGEAAEDQGGEAISLSSNGTILAIGTPYNDGNGDRSGHVRVYQYNGTSWTQLGQDIDGEAVDDRSGRSVSLSSDGTILAIGASGNDGNGSWSGHVRVYQYNGTTWTQLGQDIDGEAAGDVSGDSVSLSSDGMTVAIGAPYNHGGNGYYNGHVRVYQWNGTDTWTQLGQDIDGEAKYDESGGSISLSSDGTILAIGAYGNDGNGSSSGHVRVYQWNGTDTWTQIGEDIDGEAAGDGSGWSVSLSSDGTILAIGAKDNDGNGSYSGHVRVYKIADSVNKGGEGSITATSFIGDGSQLTGLPEPDLTPYAPLENPTFTGDLTITEGDITITGSETVYTPLDVAVQLGSDIDGEAAGDQSGYSVSLSQDGTIVAIGAPFNDGTTGNIDDNRGHVRVYQWNGTTWTQLGQDIDGEAADDRSGQSISLSSDGTILAIGAYWNDGNGSNSGHLRVYQWNGTAWTQLGQDINGEAAGDASGQSVSLSNDGTIVAIGAHYNDGNGSSSGHVRVYQYNGTTWTQLGQDIDGEAAGDYSGGSVSLSSDGNILSVGAYGNDGNGSISGHVRVYQWDGTTWTQLGQDIDGEAAGDFSGYSVSLSNDGTIVAIGAFFNDGNGSDSGHVRVYQYNGTDTWTQVGQDIDGEAGGDESGQSVSLSSDGTILAIGAYRNDGNGDSSGHVRVYQWNGTDTWTQLGQDIDGEATDDRSGHSISLSSDGTILAIGAHMNDGNGSNSGHVRVYKIANLVKQGMGEGSITAKITKMTGITTEQRDALTAEAGMIIFNSTVGKHQGYNGSTWNNLY